MKLPNELLIEYSKKYPTVGANIESMLQSKGKDLPDWPKWCFAPMAAWHAIVSTKNQNDFVTIANDTGILAAIGTWRYSQGIYRIDQSMYDMLISTDFEGKLPSDVFFCLPEWCIYIEAPGLSWTGEDIHGFWVHLEHDVKSGQAELRLLFNTAYGPPIPFPLYLGAWTIAEAIQRMQNTTSQVLQSEAAQRQFGAGASNFVTQFNTRQMQEDLKPILSLVLYICSDEPDIDDSRQPGTTPTRPQMKKTKKGWRLFPAEKARIWSVGVQTGQALRQANASDISDTDKPTGRTVSPHLRRAHWHAFWKGPRNGERKLTYRWLPPMMVSSADSE